MNILHKINIKLKKLEFDKINTYFLFMFAFFLPLSRAINSFFVIYFIVILFFNKYRKRLFETYRNNSLILIIIFLLYLTISILWSEDKIEGVAVLRYYWQWLAIFGIAVYISSKPQEIKNVISAFIFGMLVSEILSYGMFFEFWQINGRGAEAPTPFMMHIDYSVFLAFTALILLNRLFCSRYSRREKILMAIFFITVVGNLFLNKGRTGQLSFLVAIFITFFLHYRVTLINLVKISLFAVIVFGTAYNVSDHFKIRIHSGIADIQKVLDGKYNSSWGLRVAQYFVAKEMIQKNPLLGTGTGGRDISVKQLLKEKDFGFSKGAKAFISTHHSHNQYIQIIIENGLIGFILMILVLYQLIKLKIQDNELNELKVIFVTVYIVAFIAEPLWLKQFTNVLFILFSGLFLGASLSKSGIDMKKNLAIKEEKYRVKT